MLTLPDHIHKYLHVYSTNNQNNFTMNEPTLKQMEVKHEQINLENEKQSKHKINHDRKNYRDRAIERKLNKKIICPHHKEKYILRCLHQTCPKPFACSNPACIYSHEHTQHMSFQKFDAHSLRRTFDRAQKIISNNEGLFDRARQIKHVIDGLKYTLTELFKDIDTFGEVCSDLKSQVDSALTSSYLGRIDQVVSLQSKIMNTLQTIKSKIVISEEIPDFYRRSEIQIFLQQNIPNFRMQTAKLIIKVDRTTIQTFKFDQILKGRHNLVFLFVCDLLVIGSYCQITYPSSTQAIRDNASFIFLTDDETTDKIVKFKANPEIQCHLYNWDDQMFTQGKISQLNKGLALSQDNPQTIDFYLPTSTYLSQQPSSKNYTGSLKWNFLIVLQTQ